ncbi:integrin alpha-PS1-like [Littorina saxatilis]|uniref:Integrin alpha-2 domain-containing protein n=1 Tax=Littorina saxatilis TaxID=31220 RepID=A0AAN9BSU6_9CAEN
MADQETRLRTGRCLAFVVVISVCYGFNLDPRFSVTKKGPADGYFGYSVTEHQIVDEGDGSVKEHLLLVGAPRQKVTVNTKKVGGAIYKCDATSTRENDCVQLTTEPFNKPPSNFEEMEDGWLGVALHSYGKGGQVVTCAHRYIQNNAGLGICYTLLQTLDYSEKWIPCMGKSHTNYLEDFGLCQAGLSAKIGPHESMVMGAPGSIFWRGVVFQANISDELGAIRGPFNSPIPVNPSEDGAATMQLPPTDKYSYLGYSVEIGSFDGSGNLYFVSGAPRAYETGEVVFFRKLPRNQVLQYEPLQKLKGQKDFAGFGSTLLAVDLNNDKFDDLIVGAPYLYEKGRGGAIYIYYGSTNMIDNNSDSKVIMSRKMSDADCEMLGCEHARFGMSLAKLGDVNNDGFQDFAVGAPYEGRGTVYIYHGSKDGVSDMYAQRITADDMPDGDQFKSFGYSLSGGLDLDANGYPDLLVGSYESGAVSLLRTRAIIRLKAEVKVIPNMIDLAADAFCQVDSTMRRCVELEICLTFTADPQESFTSRPIIQYAVEAERTRSFARLEMVQSQDASKKVVEGSMELFRQGSGRVKCVKQLAYLKDVFADKLNPMELSVKFYQDEAVFSRPNPGDPLPDINQYPILSTEGTAAGAEANTVSTYVDFVKECGADNKCYSNLQFEVKLDAKNEGGRYVLRDGEFSRVDISFTVTNLGEAAYLTMVYIKKPPKLDYQGVSGKGQDGVDVKCLPQEGDDTLIYCNDIGNPLKKGSSVTFTLKLNNRIQSSEQLMNITTWVNTSSTEQTPENDKQVFPFMVIREADLVLSVNVRPDDQILCSGDPRGASAMTTEKDIGPAVNHSFIVTNRGPSNVIRSTLVIEWPHEVSDGKFLLYLMQAPIVEKGDATCNLEEDTINPLGITSSIPVTVDRFEPLDPGRSRGKRQAQSEARVKRAQGGLEVLGCKQNTARCRKITCQLGNLQGGLGYVKITLRARLWESTLLQDYKKAGDVQISSYGYLQIDPDLRIQQDTSNDRIEAVTYAVPDFKESGAGAVEWWWILLAVLGGILLLVLIIFCLYKIGFFKRKRPEEMQMYQAEKKHNKMLDDTEEDGV